MKLKNIKQKRKTIINELTNDEDNIEIFERSFDLDFKLINDYIKSFSSFGNKIDVKLINDYIK